MQLTRRTTLRFQEGSSDKVYEVDIVAVDGGHLVNFRYGRSGKALTEGCKTASPVALPQAEKVANSLLVSKMNKGYQVLMGYDPVSGETVGALTAAASNAAPRKGKQTQQREQRIRERLSQFAEGKQDAGGLIEGFSLTRSLWKAGELRIPELSPALQAVLEHPPGVTRADPMFYYALAWAAGRSRDAAVLPLLDQIKDKVPAHLYQFACLQAGRGVQECLPEPEEALDVAAVVSAIQSFDHYAAMSFNVLTEKDHAYIQHVLHWHGLTDAVRQALERTVLGDADQDCLQLHFSAEDYAKISAGKAAFPALQPAILDVLRYHYNALLDNEAQKYASDFALYTELLTQINLEQALDNSYYIERAREGNLRYMWDSAARNLKNALKATGKVKDINSLWQRVINYYNLQSSKQSAVSAERLQQCYAVLREQQAYDEVVNQRVPTLRADGYFYRYQQDFSPELESRYDTSLAYHIKRLFNDRFAALRQEALKPRGRLLEQYDRHVTALYARASVQPEYREAALEAIRLAPVNQSFTAAFRKLYKMAEFLDDFPALAVLNHRIETTPDEGKRQPWRDENPAFTQQSRRYLRRRTVRLLRKLGKFAPPAYLQLAQAILLLVDDASPAAQRSAKKQLVYFPQLAAANFILHRHSHVYEQDFKGDWALYENRGSEASQPEAFASAWAYAGPELLTLLLQCKAAVVNDFALRRLQPQTAFLQEQPRAVWLQLLLRPYENTATLAVGQLAGSLHELEVMHAVLRAQFPSVRLHALRQLTADHFQQNRALLPLLLLSEYDDVYQLAKDYLYTAQADYPALATTLLEGLLAADENRRVLLPRLQWLLTQPLHAQVALAQLQALLAHPEAGVQHLGAILLADSDYAFEALGDCFALMAASAFEEVRAGAVALLAKLDDAGKRRYLDLLCNALTDTAAYPQQAALQVLREVADPGLQQAVFAHILPVLFRAEPVEGYSDAMLAIVQALAAMHRTVDADVLWRLLAARSKLAERAGAILLGAQPDSIFSIKQWAILTKNPTLQVRNTAMQALQALQANRAQVAEQFAEAVRILDNRWDDTRASAIAFFRGFPDDFWSSERVVAVCDNVYADVQQFGRDLVLRSFAQGAGEQYLLQLSQHPANGVQLFVSHFLEQHAGGKPAVILALAGYFRTMLSLVNRGRLLKDRVIAFLFKAAAEDEQVARMVADLFTDQSLSTVIADKSRYIRTLFELHNRYGIEQTPIKVVAPPVRAF